MKPLVSILIPCFNAERWIAQCIESALAQTWPEKEVIVVDDGSTDRSLEIINRFGNGEVICSDTRIPPPWDPWVLLASWRLPQTGGPLWRKASLLKVSGWRPDQPCCQEHELYFRLLASGCRFEHCGGCFAVYRD